MNSDDLLLFAQVAKSRSISRAAVELGADQSTVSRRIGVLETQLGVRLFHRSGRGVSVTERGEQLLEYAKALQDTLESAERSMRESADLGPSKLCIASQPTVAKNLFGQLIKTLKQKYPNTQIQVVEALGADIVNRLNDGSVDIAVFYLPQHPGSLRFDALLTEEVKLVAPIDYPLPGNTISVHQLSEIPLILPSTHYGIRLMVETIASKVGFTPNIALLCDGSTSITTTLVADGCGCTMQSEASVLSEIERRIVKTYTVTDHDLNRSVVMAWPRNRPTGSSLWAVTQLIRKVTTEIVESGRWPGAKLIPAKKRDPML
ncbi:LysR family transcriptional regulator [Pantoea sp. Tr-811]|uniref:LysR family transcriptional regulator n=1 Tax=Pantoea sp. Tr-811 TaxID=2608361 RepID=UPI00141E8BB0|nr:LysR family transcriptional regulator [Pantoea sp. Tr-811]NIF30302.1 LysR family transcriptional regulator [Pantoea sp. Tr-811]